MLSPKFSIFTVLRIALAYHPIKKQTRPDSKSSLAYGNSYKTFPSLIDWLFMVRYLVKKLRKGWYYVNNEAGFCSEGCG